MLEKTILITVLVALVAGGASATTYTINPPAGTVTNVTQKYTGKNTIAINTVAPPDSGGTVYLNSANTHSSGTTLTYGTLVIQTANASELGTGTFTQYAGGTLHYTGPSGGEWSKKFAFANTQNDYVWQIDNDLSILSDYISTGYLLKTGAGTLTFKSLLNMKRSSCNTTVAGAVLEFSEERAPTCCLDASK